MNWNGDNNNQELLEDLRFLREQNRLLEEENLELINRINELQQYNNLLTGKELIAIKKK